jgi:hypothetical protein
MPVTIMKIRKAMMKNIFYFLTLFLLLKANTYAGTKGKDSLNTGFYLLKPYKLTTRYFPEFRKDSFSYTLPSLTIHLGASIGLSDGSARLNTNGSSGTRVNFKEDLGFPSSAFFPRVNIVLASKQQQFIFDINNINITKTTVALKPYHIGNLDIPFNTSVRSKFNLFFINLSYRHAFLRKKHYNIGGLLGVDLHQYSLRVENKETGESDKTSFSVWTPLIGLDIYGFVHKDFFFRGTFNGTALPFHNYDLTQLSFKSYFEYYLFRNFGVGLGYNYFYSDIRQFSKINGNLKYQIHSVSLFASFRFYKK